MDDCDRVGAGASARRWAHTVGLMLIIDDSVEDRFTARSEHALQQWSAILLASCLVLLLEGD